MAGLQSLIECYEERQEQKQRESIYSERQSEREAREADLELQERELRLRERELELEKREDQVANPLGEPEPEGEGKQDPSMPSK